MLHILSRTVSLSLSFARAATTAVYDSHDYLLVFVLRGALTCRPKLVARHYRHGERERERQRKHTCMGSTLQTFLAR